MNENNNAAVVFPLDPQIVLTVDQETEAAEGLGIAHGVMGIRYDRAQILEELGKLNSTPAPTAARFLSAYAMGFANANKATI